MDGSWSLVPDEPFVNASDEDAPMCSAEPVVYSASSEGTLYVDTGPLPSWIVNGKVSAPCAWPSTVAVPGCTGTLIHPRVVISAAHCNPRAGWTVKFGEKSGSPAFSVTAEKCKAGPGASSSTGKGDWAYCVLPEDDRLKQVPYTPPLFGCEWDRYLKVGMKVWTVGFGDTASGSGDYGTKREVEVPLNKIGDGYVDIGLANGTGNCHGDSGGPVFVHLADGANDWGWRVFGMTHGPGSGNCDCTCTTVFSTTKDVVPVIETNEGIDVTPCMDATGMWTGGPECTGFPLDPGKGGGSYPTCGGMKTGPIDSCGVGTGGTGGMGGTGGTSGAGGSGGVAGTGAVGGTGGASGTGGSAGTAGTGAVGGVGGSGATGGVAGTGAVGGTGGVGGSGGVAGAGGTGAVAGSGAVGGSSGSGGMAGAGGTGGMGGSAGQGGVAGSGASGGVGAGGVGGSAGSGATTGVDVGTTDPGCACNAPGARDPRSASWLAALAALGLAMRRRRDERRKRRKPDTG